MGSPEMMFWGLFLIIGVMTWYVIVPMIDYALAQMNIDSRNQKRVQATRGVLLLLLAVFIAGMTQSAATLVYAIYGGLMTFAILSFLGLNPRQRRASAK